MRETVRRSLVAAAVGAAIAAVPAALAAVPAATAAAETTTPWPGHSVYVQTDSPAGNQIVVLSEHRDGRLSKGQAVATGGLGGQASGAAVDELASQSSLVYDASRKLLFSVNAGSNTLSVLSTQGSRPRLLQVIGSGGSFPDSVAVRGDLVYVLNAGGPGTLSGYRLTGTHLTPIPGSSRSLGLANTTPPNYLASPGQVGFTPQGELIVTTKGSTSSLDVFSVSPAGRLSPAPAITADPGNDPFSFTFSRSGQLVVAESGNNALHTYAASPAGALDSLSASVPDGQSALCWVTPAGGYYYVANAGSNSVSAYTVAANGTPSLVGVVAATDTGPIDMAASANGQTLYVEAGGAGAVDEYHIAAGGSLSSLGAVTGLGAGIEGIAAS